MTVVHRLGERERHASLPLIVRDAGGRRLGCFGGADTNSEYPDIRIILPKPGKHSAREQETGPPGYNPFDLGLDLGGYA